MSFREKVFEDLAADLEYHPKRGLLYLGLAAVAITFWICLRPENRMLALPLICGLGGTALLLKGVFLLRRSSEGLGLTQQELDRLSAPSHRKVLPPVPILLAQLIQDFGTGSLLLSPVLHTLKNINEAWALPTSYVFLGGAFVFAVGWLIRHFADSSTTAT
jgi:hypothetical protein